MGKRGQAAMEFLMTYGWVILVIGLAMGIMAGMGWFNNSNVTQASCIFPGTFNCETYLINNTGVTRISLGQMTSQTIQVTAMRCTQEINPTLNESDRLADPVRIPTGEHLVVTTGEMPCWRVVNNTLVKANRSSGPFYRGKLYVEYEDMETGFAREAVADVLLKFEDVVIPTPTPRVPVSACRPCQYCEDAAFGTCSACQQGHIRDTSCGSVSCGCAAPSTCNGGGACVAPQANGKACNCSAMCISGICSGSPSTCQPVPAIPGNITGYITDFAGQPIFNIQVTVTGPTACTKTTDPQGQYRCTGLKNGAYWVSASRHDYIKRNVSVQLAQAQEVQQNLTLIASLGWIEGFVSDTNGQPVAFGAQCSATDCIKVIRNGAECTTAGFNVVGQYSCDNYPAGNYTVQVNKTGYYNKTGLAVVVAGLPTRLDFTLRHV